ncbi:hypothetical protein [Hydrogenophaga sp.]|uniref:hypothetical protein n=1 Tax=Hydrogenophaga sp. TaxID=1904254 RepID=UPI0016B2612C|nr:hypothetical protein [Hydrogenophaga sp.]NIQ63261.1 hypothetical protein [Hydrogenophaga sp.]
MIDLVPRPPSWAKPTIHRAQRAIQRWKTKALFQALLDETGASGPYDLESKLIEAYGDALGPRCSAFDRMKNLGQPDLEKKLSRLARDPANASRWIYHATLYAPKALDVLREAIWRLLDPTPIGHIELAALSERRYSEREDPRCINVVLTDLAGFPEDDEWVYIGTGATKKRQGLTQALFDMRYAELWSNERAYHLHLLSAMERLSSKELDPDLQVLGAECCDYLATYFGRIEVPEEAQPAHVIELRLALSAYLGADPFGVISGAELEWCPR